MVPWDSRRKNEIELLINFSVEALRPVSNISIKNLQILFTVRLPGLISLRSHQLMNLAQYDWYFLIEELSTFLSILEITSPDRPLAVSDRWRWSMPEDEKPCSDEVL